jgi:hypothetical protein
MENSTIKCAKRRWIDAVGLGSWHGGLDDWDKAAILKGPLHDRQFNLGVGSI